MGARKGYKGESCDEVIWQIVSAEEVISCSKLFERVKSRGAWSDDTIWLHFIARTANCVPSRYRWPTRKQILFLRPDGQYERYDAKKHPRVIE